MPEFGKFLSLSPRDLLSELLNIGSVEHDAESKDGVLAVFLKLLLEWLLKVYPSQLVTLVDVLEPKVHGLRVWRI